MPDDEAALTAGIVELAKRYGYRPIAALLRTVGWKVNHKQVEWIWRREGLKVPARQQRRGRLCLTDGSCIQLRPERPGHVWAYGFVEDRTYDGHKFRILTVIDEFSRECRALTAGRQLRSDEVLATLTDLFVAHGPPEHIRFDQSSEFIANVVKARLARIGVRTLSIEKASPWENGYKEPFKGKLPDKLHNREIFYRPGRSQGPDRNRALALQHTTPTHVARISVNGARDGRVTNARPLAPPSGRLGLKGLTGLNPNLEEFAGLRSRGQASASPPTPRCRRATERGRPRQRRPLAAPRCQSPTDCSAVPAPPIPYRSIFRLFRLRLYKFPRCISWWPTYGSRPKRHTLAVCDQPLVRRRKSLPPFAFRL